MPEIQFGLSIIRNGEAIDPVTGELPFSESALFLQSGNGTESIPCTEARFVTDVNEIDEDCLVKFPNEAFNIFPKVATSTTDITADPGYFLAPRPTTPKGE